MKKTLFYSLAVLLLASAACNKTEVVVSDDAMIRFAPANESTRAELIKDEAALQAVTFQVYDFKDGAEYINNKIKYDTATSSWAYVDEEDYLWKATEHKLFGYTSSLGLLASADKTVTYVATLTTDANQTDLLYSDIVTVTADEWKHTAGNTKDTPVTLTMKHLFSAVSIYVVNNKTSEITLNSVNAPANIASAGTALINYNGTDVAVSYEDLSSTVSFVTADPLANQNLPSQKTADVLKQAVAEPTTFVVWPQRFPGATITVKYSMGGRSYESSVTLPEVAWERSKNYTYTLVIGDVDDILLDFTVKEWETGSAEEYVFE